MRTWHSSRRVTQPVETIKISAKQLAADSPARVVYSRALEDGRYEVGVEFIDVAEDDLMAIARHFNWDTDQLRHSD